MNTDTPNTPATFAFDSHALRVVTDAEGQPWFVAADVLLTLELDRKALERVEDDDKGVSSIHTLGGPQLLTTVNEPGLYGLVLGSRKPEAKRFKRWVTHEVLPALRKTGRYAMPGAEPDPAGPPIGVFTVIEAVETARHPEARAALHGLLANHCRAHGLYVPVLGRAEGRAPRLSAERAALLRRWFWEAVTTLGHAGCKANHARSGVVEAYSIKQVRRLVGEMGLRVFEGRELAEALRGDARFVRVATVNSGLTHASVKCWLFHPATAGAAPALVH